MTIVDLTPKTDGRRFSMLVPFIQKAEFDAHLQAGGFALWDAQAPDVAWTAAHAAMRAAPAYRPDPVEPLPAHLQPQMDRIRQRETYFREYASKADVHVGMVRLGCLISPQPLADLDYVEQLGAQLSRSSGPEADMDFSFPIGSLPEPLVNGNSLLFNGQTGNILVNQVPQYRRLGEDIEAVIRVSARPNYVFVAELRDRLVLLNGVHKVLTLIGAGRTLGPAIIRRANGLPELGLPTSTLQMQIEQPRPPLVSDFLQPLAVLLERRPTRTLTRVVIQSDQIQFPE